MNFRLCPQFRSTLFPAGKTCATGDNGVDPILGPPHPPVNYQLSINPLAQPRLTWTVPDVIVEGVVADTGNDLPAFEVTITNYSWPAWASGDQGYIINSRVTYGGVRYYSIQQPNISNQPNISPSYWAEDPTEFELWYFFGGQFIRIGQSVPVAIPFSSWDWDTLTFTTGFGVVPSDEWAFFVSAVSGSSSVVSNTLGFDGGCTPPGTPGLISLEDQGSLVVSVQWDPPVIDPTYDYVLFVGPTPGGPYQTGYVGLDPGELTAELNFPDYGTWYCVIFARNARMCGSAPSNELSVVVSPP